MSVADRWHRRPKPGLQPCKCGRGRNKLYPSAAHLQGDRWMVRWRDPATKEQLARNFALREGNDPELHADAYDKLIAGQILTRTYIDPRSAEETLQQFAEKWLKGRKYKGNRGVNVGGHLLNHVYEDKARPGSGRTRRGGVSIGQHSLGLLDGRPSLIEDWIEALPLAPGTKRGVVGTVSQVFRAAKRDGIVRGDPTHAEGVRRPGYSPPRRRVWTREHVDAVAAALPARYRVVPYLGTGAAQRQGEIFGLAVGDVDWLARKPMIRTVRQVKIVDGKQYFAPTKNRKERSAPLALSLRARLSAHLDSYPAVEVTLPWYDPDDPERHLRPETVRLVVTSGKGGALYRQAFNKTWDYARVEAGIVKPPPKGKQNTTSRQDGMHVMRHTAVSNWLRAGIDIVRVAAWIGDTVQVVATTYAHEIPKDDGSDGRAAVEGFLGDGPSATNVEDPEAKAELGQAGALPGHFNWNKIGR